MIYFNENNPYAVQWLRNLIEQGHLPDGRVDDRSILAVRPADIDAEQCHFFAGVGGWPYALDLAGWPRTRPVWTASLPCQPLSVAGQRKGALDERHLWPAFHRLVAERRPATILGEQVASQDGREWLAAVRADLEALGYACGAACLPAAGVGAPHRRYRLFWVAHADNAGLEGRRQSGCQRAAQQSAGPGGVADGLADAKRRGSGIGLGDAQTGNGSEKWDAGAHRMRGAADGVADADCNRTTERDAGRLGENQRATASEEPRRQQTGEAWTGRPADLVADAEGERQRSDRPRQDRGEGVELAGSGPRRNRGDDGAADRMADADRRTCGKLGKLGAAQGDGIQEISRQGTRFRVAGNPSAADGLADAAGEAAGRGRLHGPREGDGSDEIRPSDQPVGGRDANPWADLVWLPCRDGKYRPTQPGLFPLAHGVSARVGRLRAYGNAITPQVAAEFIAAYLEEYPS